MSEVFVKETGVGRLNVEGKFESLVGVAMGANSAYIRAKESMLEYFASANLSEREKADILSKLVGGMASSITGEAMQAAIKIETEDRDAPYALAKVVADVKNTQQAGKKVFEDTRLTRAEVDKIRQDIKSAKVEDAVKRAGVLSKTGIDIIDSAGNAQYSNTVTSVFGDSQSAVITMDEVARRSQKVDRYTKLAASYMKDGSFDVTNWSDTVSIGKTTSNLSVTLKDANGNDVTGSVVVPALDGLVGAQTQVAIRNKKGFDDNMLQHAVNASANTYGLLVSSQSPALDTPEGGQLMKDFSDALNALVVGGTPT